MRIPRWLVAGTAVALIAGGCVGNDKQERFVQPSATTIAADADPTTEPTPEPIETIDEEPTEEPGKDGKDAKEPEPNETTPEAIRTRTAKPGVTIIVPVNTVQLSCRHIGRLPSLASTNGNEYPRIVFNAMCASESSGNRVSFTFGQVGANEGVECGTEYYINGDSPKGIAWWCPKLEMLISSPAAVLDSSNSQRLRELTIAYSMAVAQTKYSKTHDTNKIVCVMGRTVKNLKDKGKLTTAQAVGLKADLNSLFANNNAANLSKLFLKAYKTGTC